MTDLHSMQLWRYCHTTLTKLLDEFLVLVQLLEVIQAPIVESISFCLIKMSFISDDADLHLGPRNVLQPEKNKLML